MGTESELRARVRAVATAAGVEISEARMERVVPQVVALLRADNAARQRNVGETEPAFGTRMKQA